MSFVHGLKLVYENEIEVLTQEYEKYAKKMLDEQFDIDSIKDELESVIVEVVSDAKQRGDSEIKYEIDGIVKSVSSNITEDNICDLIIPHKFMPLFSDVIGENDKETFVENLQLMYPFRSLTSRIEKDISGVEFVFDFKVKFQKESDGKYVISKLTWNPTLIFEW